MWWQPMFEAPNIKTCVEKQQKFFCEFVDIKRNGWRHYSTALNELNHGFYGPLLKRMDQQVDDFAEVLKTVIRTPVL
jgi:hypothetical protein